MFDIIKLPEKYYYNNSESLTENKYIDDNSLYICYCISKGLFCENPDLKLDAGSIFLFFHPFEWTSIDFISFLLFIGNKYNLKIENIETYLGAIEDDYEVSYEPRQYGGAYDWILELEEKEPNREEVILFNKFRENIATVKDIERALIYATRIAPASEDEKNELYFSKDIFIEVLNYTHFSFSKNSVKKSKIENDVNSYIKLFIKEKLFISNKPKRIGDVNVRQSENIYTYKKHSKLFEKYLQKMQGDFGNDVIIENIFEERFPNLEYPDSNFIRNRYSNKNFFFCHILLSFQKQGLLKIFHFGNNRDTMYEDKTLTYKARVKILPAFLNEEMSKKLYFDEDKSRFYVQGKEIKLLKFKDEYQVLRAMFEDLNELEREWFFSELSEIIDEGVMNDKKYYNAIYQIKIKLEKKGIEDFFITTRQSVIINKKYLS